MGYWEPHSSSVDFCETNYLSTDYVVEIHNSWSSLAGISAFGVIGLFKGNPTREKRHTLGYIVLIITGLGSTGLHGTLNWIFQSSDELPMLYLVMCLLYMCAEHDAPMNMPNHPNLPRLLGASALIVTSIYYIFQSIYIVFILTFILEATMSIGWIFKILFAGNQRSLLAKKLGVASFISIALVGFPLWLYDMFQCETFINSANSLPFLLKGITPHVIWHFGAGYAAYCAIICLACCRMEELNIKYDFHLLGYILPTIKLSEKLEGHELGDMLMDRDVDVSSIEIA
mmetsp:Transcript_7094/g.10166  ORF Transcript_7094/g.10166 Transcript_7094/m.10166 type:complete len:286 (-) Transcript_7094:478-1335(-)|eukprot:CAMPEP_0184868272 /NCGR_PEP_ID=MMETSP0580-20130426/29804_1 /TAXON_ID=1118495 /ORGANISM="Dactyliosolen fragilissimus" /LENGTH=285 /DNA_ID=CAMNT_0027369057 /DNA_START=179 /DNA_END=1036 /DNA_ORIENTATION=-